MEEFSLIKKFSENCAAHPNHTAIIDVAKDTSMTYHELDVASGRVYRYLTEHNIGKEDVVMILLPRGEKPFIALVGVLKSGAASVMLETDYPTEKREFIKRDADCCLVIDEGIFEEMMLCDSKEGYIVTEPHDLLRLIYTSGTTGNPKGVMHEYGIQKMDVASCSCEGNRLLKYGDIFAFLTPLNFIASTFIFYAIISESATLAVFPIEISHNISQLLFLINRYHITVGFFSPSLLLLISKFPACVKTIITGSDYARNIYYEGVDLFNTYAQTEAGCLLLTLKVDKRYELIPAGKPVLSENDVCVLDAKGRRVKDGEVGEVCCKNPYVRGYLNLPDRNNTLFTHGYIRTGDVAKILPDGNFLILGRIDDMVKINGNRVEPAEIEVAVKKVLGTEWVGVRVFAERGKSFICAYYIGEPVLPIDKAKEILRGKLVPYMVPTFYIKIDKIPLNANGKFKRDELPTPDFSKYWNEYVAPANELEEKLCNTMRSVLGVERVGAIDDFYEIGGDSISAIKVITQMNLSLLNVNMLLKGRTPKGIAALYEEQAPTEHANINAQNAELLLTDQPFSKAQQIFCSHYQNLPNSTKWNLPVLLKFEQDTDIVQLKKAVDTVLAAHPVFSCVFAKIDDKTIVHRYNASKIFDIKIEEITEGEFELVKDKLVMPFEIFGKPLYRAKLFSTENGGYLFLDFHHSIVDATAIQLFVQDICRVYEGLPLQPDYYFVALQERRKLENSPLYEEGRDYYEKLFGEDLWSTCLHTDFETKDFGHGTITETILVAPEVYKNLYRLYGIGENAFFNVVSCLVISMLNNKKNVAITWTHNGRESLVEKNVVGALFRRFWIGIRFDDERTIGDIYHDVAVQMLNNIYYSCYLYRGPHRTPHGSKANLNLLKELKKFTPMNSGFHAKLSLTSVFLPQENEIPYDQPRIEIVEDGAGCKLTLEYNACAYKKESISRFKDMFTKTIYFLSENIDNPNLCISEIIKTIRNAG